MCATSPLAAITVPVPSIPNRPPQHRSNPSSTAPLYKKHHLFPIRTLATPETLPCSAATTDVGEGGEERTGGGAQKHRVVTLNVAVRFVKPEEA